MSRNMIENKAPTNIDTGCVPVGNFQLGYRIEGTGTPAIVIGSSIYYPRTFSQNLRHHLRLIFIDHRGFSPQPASLEPSEYTLDTILDDIEQIRKTLGLTHFILIGHSGHGYMALEYTKKYPDVVSHLVLLAMSPDGNPKSFAAADRCFQESVCPERKALLAKNLANLQAEIEANPSHAFITRVLKFGPMIWYNEHFDAIDMWRDVKVIPEVMDYLWGKVFREIDITKNLDKLNCPVFLGLGRYDYWNPPYLWEAIRPDFKSLTIRIFEKSGHTPQYEEAELFDNELLQWLSSLKIKI
jgi:proline iminopeptidase